MIAFRMRVFYISILTLPDEHTMTSFAFQEWRRDWIALTNNWQTASNLYPTAATGDALEIAITLYEKYANLIVDTRTSAMVV